MKIYYTGASSYNAEQPLASRSLGGFLSSSEVRNARAGNLFDDSSEIARKNLYRQSVLIAVKNDSLDVMDNLRITFGADFSVISSQFEIAFVAPQSDSCGNIAFGRISSQTDKPYVDLDVLSSNNNIFDLPPIAAGEIFGLWIVKTPIKDKTKALTCDELNTLFEAKEEASNVEDFNIVFDWKVKDLSNSQSASASSSGNVVIQGDFNFDFNADYNV